MTTYEQRYARWMDRCPGECPRDTYCAGCLTQTSGACIRCQDRWDERHTQPWLDQQPKRVSRKTNLAIAFGYSCRGDGGRSSTHPYGSQTAASGGVQ